jgi:hypothetical protein
MLAESNMLAKPDVLGDPDVLAEPDKLGKPDASDEPDLPAEHDAPVKLDLSDPDVPVAILNSGFSIKSEGYQQQLNLFLSEVVVSVLQKPMIFKKPIILALIDKIESKIPDKTDLGID